MMLFGWLFLAIVETLQPWRSAECENREFDVRVHDGLLGDWNRYRTYQNTSDINDAPDGKFRSGVHLIPICHKFFFIPYAC
jgi:hypothetical protein